mgnify:CR=1 FL=1
MIAFFRSITCVALIALVMAPAAFAQQREMDQGMRYDTTTVETIEGTVASVDTMQQGRGIHVQLDTGNETLDVHVGPLAYLNQHNFALQAGDRIRVRGSRVTHNGAPSLIAADIHHGDQSWTLRDENGIPKWRGMM